MHSEQHATCRPVRQDNGRRVETFTGDTWKPLASVIAAIVERSARRAPERSSLAEVDARPALLGEAQSTATAPPLPLAARRDWK